MPGWYAAAYGENGSTRAKGIPVRYVVARFAGREGPEGLPARFGGPVWTGSAAAVRRGLARLARFGGPVWRGSAGSAGRFGAVWRGGSGRFGGSAVRLGHILQPAFELSRVAAIVGLPRGLFRGADVEHGPQGQGIAALVCLAPGRL
jgi:hypothetical protein